MVDNAAHSRAEAPSDPSAGAVFGGAWAYSESEFLLQLGRLVRGLRVRRDMTRRELARRSGISERYLSLIETGKANVSVVLLLRIAQAVRGDESAM